MTTYSIRKEVQLEFDEAVTAVKDSLKQHGFGVLSEIDASAKLQEKLGVEMDEYVILGACNPQNAYKGLQEEQELGLLLPCNVIVYREDGTTHVSAIRATQALQVTRNDALQPVAEEVENGLRQVIETL